MAVITKERITIDPITRLEGHGKIEIFLDKEGEVNNTYFQIPELRGFERFCVGRPVEEMPVLTNRICGVCPEAHHMAAAKAADAVYHVDPPRPAKLLRELLYMGFYFTDHTTHFYALGGPDFVMGPDAPVAERNILGVIHKVGLEIGGKVIQARKYGHTVVEMLGGRKVHPCTSVPGGVTKGLDEDERVEIERMGRWGIEFAQFSLKLFKDLVLGNKTYLDLILGDIYAHRTYSIGLVDAQNRVNFYDGLVSVTSPSGKRIGKYAPNEYTDWIAERVEPWTYLKFPYLKKVGWKGLVDGEDSGVYMATPLSRLNAADSMATPLAQEQYEEFYTTLGGKPVHQRLAIHWARLIELLYAAERWVELATDQEITSTNIRKVPAEKPTEGVGIVEAPRGTLTHHYQTDDRGILTRVNLIVGTTNNYAPISMSIKKAAQNLIHNGTVVTEGLTNMVEMAFRAYDPCFGCATHSLPGQMPLEVTVRNAEGEKVEVVRQHC
ncbi:MAG: Ni/Fe hydrogenase subunit alpha [Anaerolineales bacterium]|nr:Ni/Fe hydrogenase subunit alpha [Anaerolineales bacterium]